ncbi:MAG: hypothetical protein HC772_05435 [Leptolyngbyaceae cyanobacterium CRU_2_3]|nr:hypothetical protein [Leptolyngbyaceae cyanobacterium CRU_2_3]
MASWFATTADPQEVMRSTPSKLLQLWQFFSVGQGSDRPAVLLGVDITYPKTARSPSNQRPFSRSERLIHLNPRPLADQTGAIGFQVRSLRF